MTAAMSVPSTTSRVGGWSVVQSVNAAAIEDEVTEFLASTVVGCCLAARSGHLG